LSTARYTLPCSTKAINQNIDPVGIILLTSQQKPDRIYQKKLIYIIIHRGIIHPMDKRICGNRDTGIVRTIAEMDLQG